MICFSDNMIAKLTIIGFFWVVIGDGISSNTCTVYQNSVPLVYKSDNEKNFEQVKP